MRLEPFKHYNTFHILPSLYITHETNYYLSIDIIWGRWGISIVLKEK